MNTGKMTCNWCGVVKRFRSATVQGLIDQTNQSGWHQISAYPFFDRDETILVGDLCPPCFAELCSSMTPYELGLKIKTPATS